MHLAMCAFFGKRCGQPEKLLGDLDETLARPIAIINLDPCDLKSGAWPIIAFRDPAYPSAWIPKFENEGAEWFSEACGPALLEAYHGLIPWDEMPATPKFYERMLLSGVPVPPTVRYKRDVMPAAQAEPSVQPEPAPQVTEGPAEIHIAILYPGSGLPTVEQLHKRQELEQRLELEEEDVGEITDAGGGEGVMDIYLETDDVQRAMPIVQRLVAELGLAEDTLIEAGPVDGEGEDDDDEDDDDEDDG